MTTTSTRETQVIADPNVPLVRIIREFNAPPAAVYRAHVEPDLIVQWLGPHGMKMTIDHYDCRPGGSYRYIHEDDSGAYAFRGCFHDVRPNEVIIQTFVFEPMPDAVALERLELEALPNGRTRLTSTSLMDSFESRDAMVASGMEVGIREGYERLDALLA